MGDDGKLELGSFMDPSILLKVDILFLKNTTAPEVAKSTDLE